MLAGATASGVANAEAEWNAGAWKMRGGNGSSFLWASFVYNVRRGSGSMVGVLWANNAVPVWVHHNTS